MKLQLVVIDLELTLRQKRLATGIVLLSLLCGASVALATVKHTFSGGETLQAKDLNDNFADLDARLTAVEAKPAGVTELTLLTVPDGQLYKAECMTNTGAFPQGACARMANYYCQSMGYEAGWFEGDLAPPNFTDPAAICVK